MCNTHSQKYSMMRNSGVVRIEGLYTILIGEGEREKKKLTVLKVKQVFRRQNRR